MYESNIIPLNSISLVAFACHPDSIALACRYLEPIGKEEYLDARMVTDAESGLTIGYRRHYNTADGKMYVNLECLFGRSVGLSLGMALATVP
jgi:hypothetical protein